MNRLSAFLLGGIAVIAVPAWADAADVPVRGPIYTKAAPAPAWSWEGQYIGIHGGHVWGDAELTLAGTADVKPRGGFGGFQIGYNYHLSRNWVLGYEVDMSFGDISSDFAPVGLQLDILAFGTARTRLGYAQGQWLFYATAGVAWARTDFLIPGSPFNFQRWHVGYAAGAGVEYAFAPNWSAKLEYIYADLGDSSAAIGPVVTNSDLTMSTLKLGLNYRFANWAAAPASAFPAKAPLRVATWNGPYIGVHGGYGQASYDSAVPVLATGNTFDGTGGFAGIQTGYNWQLSRNVVIGLESDSSWGSLRDGAAFKADSMGTIRGRLGYAMNNVLFYATGGIGWIHADVVATNDIRDQYFLGWTAGVGVEYAFSPRWSAKLEYLHADYGTFTHLDGVANTAIVGMTSDVVKLGLNYRAGIFDLLGVRW